MSEKLFFDIMAGLAAWPVICFIWGHRVPNTRRVISWEIPGNFFAPACLVKVTPTWFLRFRHVLYSLVIAIIQRK